MQFDLAKSDQMKTSDTDLIHSHFIQTGGRTKTQNLGNHFTYGMKKRPELIAVLWVLLVVQEFIPYVPFPVLFLLRFDFSFLASKSFLSSLPLRWLFLLLFHFTGVLLKYTR